MSKIADHNQEQHMPLYAHASYQTRGIFLALLVMVSWCGHLFYTLKFAAILSWQLPLHLLFQSFLNVGLFIIAHDAIHGSLAPGRHRLNNFIGACAIFMYGGFLWAKMRDHHHAHHRAPVTSEDPDYAMNGDERFFFWIGSFVVRYYSWRNFALMHIHVFIAYLISGSLLQLLVFFAVPAWLSALQLFTFGVYLPHKTPPGGHQHEANTRSLD